MSLSKLPAKSAISSIGEPIAQIEARFSPKILELFSEHLYSSSNKAFEELVTNSWDAQASSVYVSIPKNLNDERAAIYILDNGNSMDTDGLQELWTIAESQKREISYSNGRKRIGKFGIGKLATYILCNELTYICKATDGIIRIVTMDYRDIDGAKERHLEKLPLSVRQLSGLSELTAILEGYEWGADILRLLEKNIPPIQLSNEWNNEYGGLDDEFEKHEDTWTLAILTSLKPKGQKLQLGWIRRLLSTALPLGSSMRIQLNDIPIESYKSRVPILKSWKIGLDLDFDEIKLEDETSIEIKKYNQPFPHIDISDIGQVTGTVNYYESDISNGKSGKIDFSNGFFVNVLGRVVNAEDNQFKLPHLNHTVFNRLRVAIRVDGLNEDISVNREAISEGDRLSIVRALLRSIFNMARREEAVIQDASFERLSQVRRDNIAGLPLGPLSSLLSWTITDDREIPPFVRIDHEIPNLKNIEDWLKETDDGSSGSLRSIEFRKARSEDAIYKYDLQKQSLIINENHPFVKGNSETSEQKDLLKDVIAADFLADSYLLASGMPRDLCEDYFWQRDRSRRLMARIRRRSAWQIIQLLDQWKDKAKPYEEIVGDALEYLGFEIERLGKSGQPEGIGTAYITPTADDEKSSFRFSYDAKSTKHSAVSTGNLNVAGLSRHREQFGTDYALVVAPSFQEGALQVEARNNKITPITGALLGKLLAISIGFGPISLKRFEEIFSLHTPAEVKDWILQLESSLDNKLSVTIRNLVSVLNMLVTPNKIDKLSFSVIAQKYREEFGSHNRPTTMDIRTIILGLATSMPSLIEVIDKDDVALYSKPDMLLVEIKRQTEVIPGEYKIGSMVNA